MKTKTMLVIAAIVSMFAIGCKSNLDNAKESARDAGEAAKDAASSAVDAVKDATK